MCVFVLTRAFGGKIIPGSEQAAIEKKLRGKKKQIVKSNKSSRKQQHLLNQSSRNAANFYFISFFFSLYVLFCEGQSNRSLPQGKETSSSATSNDPNPNRVAHIHQEKKCRDDDQ